MWIFFIKQYSSLEKSAFASALAEPISSGSDLVRKKLPEPDVEKDRGSLKVFEMNIFGKRS